MKYEYRIVWGNASEVEQDFITLAAGEQYNIWKKKAK